MSNNLFLTPHPYPSPSKGEGEINCNLPIFQIKTRCRLMSPSRFLSLFLFTNAASLFIKSAYFSATQIQCPAELRPQLARASCSLAINGTTDFLFTSFACYKASSFALSSLALLNNFDDVSCDIIAAVKNYTFSQNYVVIFSFSLCCNCF